MNNHDRVACLSIHKVLIIFLDCIYYGTYQEISTFLISVKHFIELGVAIQPICPQFTDTMRNDTHTHIHNDRQSQFPLLPYLLQC